MENYVGTCVTCGKTIMTDKDGMSNDQPLYVRFYGGYGDFYDNWSDSEEESINYIPFCHKCAHRIVRLMGKNIIKYVDPLSTTSHVRPYKSNRDSESVSWWHFGWDNVTLRGYISACFHYFRLAGFKGVGFAFRHLFQIQNWDTFNKSISSYIPTKFNIGFLRLPRPLGLMVMRKLQKDGIQWKG